MTEMMGNVLSSLWRSDREPMKFKIETVKKPVKKPKENTFSKVMNSITVADLFAFGF